MIPKIIHYCWFGKGELPDEYQEYISGWDKLHSEWKIIRWDESNSPMELPYIQKAYSLRNWANISNLVRFYALMKHGGIYLDTDIKVLKSLDNFLTTECFLGFESYNDDTGEFWVNNAVIGAIANHEFCLDCFSEIQSQYDGSEKANLSAPVIVTTILKEKWGLKKYGLQKLNAIDLYPIDYFYPIRGFESYKAKSGAIVEGILKDSYTIHCWGRAWYSREMFVKDIEVLQEYTSDLVNLNKSIKEQLEKEHLLLENVQQQNTELLHLLNVKEDMINKLNQDISGYMDTIQRYQKQYDENSTLGIIINRLKSKI